MQHTSGRLSPICCLEFVHLLITTDSTLNFFNYQQRLQQIFHIESVAGQERVLNFELPEGVTFETSVQDVFTLNNKIKRQHRTNRSSLSKRENACYLEFITSAYFHVKADFALTPNSINRSD